MSGVNAQESSAPGGLAFLAQTDWEGPVTVIDLVKFKPGGEISYDEYDALAETKLKSLGGEVIFRGYSKPFEGGVRIARLHELVGTHLSWAGIA